MDKTKLRIEIKEIFDTLIEQVEKTRLIPKWSIPTQFPKSLPYWGYEKQLTNCYPSPWDSLLYYQVYSLENETEFVKAKSNKKKEKLLIDKNQKIYLNVETLLTDMYDVQRDIKYDIIDELILLKADILKRFDYKDLKEFKKEIEENLSSFKPEHIGMLWYIQDKNLAKEYPYDSNGDVGYRDLFEGRFNTIAGHSIVATKAYYGIEGYERLGENEDFYVYKEFKIDNRDWKKKERYYTYNKLYVEILNMLNSKVSPISFLRSKKTSIFNDGFAAILHDILIETNGIDEHKKPVKGKFQPICHAFYTLKTEKHFSVFKTTTTLKEFIEYLNEKDTYNANLKNSSKLSSGQNHYNRVKELVSLAIDKQG